MANTEKPAIQLVADTSIHVDKDDLVAVGVSRAEAELQKRCREAQHESDRLRREADERQAEANKLLDEHAREQGRGVADDMARLATAFGAPPDALKPTIRHLGVGVAPAKKAGPGGYAKTYDVEVNLDYLDPKPGGLTGQTDRRFSVYRRLTCDTPPAVLEAMAAADRMAQESAQKRSEALHWKTQETKLPQMERQLRGKLAEQRLSSTQEGRDMLDAMTIDFDNGTLALPERKGG